MIPDTAADTLTDRAINTYSRHEEVSSCPDPIIDFLARPQVYDVIVHHGGSALIRPGCCPRCGTGQKQPDRARLLIFFSTVTPTSLDLERPTRMRSAELPRAVFVVRDGESPAAARFLRHADFISCSLQAGS